MSIYSGFSTRNQETLYGKLCEELVIMLANRVMKAMKNELADDTAFSQTLISIYTKMSKLELHKYLPPKLSQCCAKLALFCTSAYPFEYSESLESFSPSRFDYDLPQIREERKTSRSRPIKSNTQVKGRGVLLSSYSPVRAPSTNSNYERLREKYTKPIVINKNSEGNAGASVQLNDGMFYRLL